MPVRKNTRKQSAAAHNKQLKRITARLIEISLKVDGYIYKQQPITAKSARMYMQEVTSYRSHCKEDARSLQVIDKLTYQMKSIIKEQEISNSDNIYEMIQNSCTREYERSPVYSLADSNITEDIVEVHDTIKLEVTSKELETINLCGDEDENIETTTNKNRKKDPHLSSVNEMQKCLSTLSLKEAAYPNETNPEVETENYSQSILDISLPPTEITQHNTVRNTSNLKITQDNQNKTKYSVPLFTCTSNDTENLIGTNASINNASKGDFMSLENKLNLNNIKPVKNKPNRKRKPKALTQILEDKKNSNLKKRKPKKAVAIEIAKVPTTIKKNKTVLPLTDKTKKQETSLKIPKPNTEVNVPGFNNNNSITKVYNNEVIEDLSWIENIRYVREITLDEFDPKLTYSDESFWDNCALPDNWDDRDFMY